MLRADLGQLSKNLSLEVDDLRHSLDDHVDLGQVVHVGCGCEASAGGVGIGLRELLLGHILGEKFVGEGEALVERFLGGVDEGDGDTCSSCSDQRDSEALWGTRLPSVS
jgi:hypothetical protein